MSKKITIKEIAEMSGVSKTTVSFYLNGKDSKMSKETKKRIEKAIAETGYQIIVGNSNYDSNHEGTYIERMLSMGVDGFIVQPTSQFRRHSERLIELNKPTVFFDSEIYDSKSSWVKTNNYEATYEATKRNN